MNKNSTIVGKRTIILTITYLLITFAAQAKISVSLNLMHPHFSLDINRDSFLFSHNAYTFEITANPKTVDLSWTTIADLENDHYEVERSFDMTNFKTVALVLGPLNSDDQYSQYSFRDSKSNIKNHNIIYYRLKHVDTEGKFTYGTVKMLRIEKK